MSAASLKNGGPTLVVQCLCNWIVKRKLHPKLFLNISVGSGVEDKCEHLLILINS